MSIYLPPGRDREEWQLAIWNADDAVLSRPQKLSLMLILEASFNSFGAFRVVGDLLANRTLWESVEMCRGFPMSDPIRTSRLHLHGDLIALRDLPGGQWNVDTLYVMHRPEHSAALTALAEKWSADEIGTHADDEACSLLGAYCAGISSILRVWWD